MAFKVEREDIFFDLTRSTCPTCLAIVDAQLLIKDNKVFMHKFCPEHGFFDSLIWSDANLYMKCLKHNKPGTIPLHFEAVVKDGCPWDCGLCPEHVQHTCLGLIEITGNCNLSCNMCFADSGKDKGFLSVDQVRAMLDCFVKAEGAPEVVQISGGEPAIHPDIIEIIKLAKARNFRWVLLNTNGIRLGTDDEFLAKIAQLGPHIFLQFDGFRDETYRALRGEGLAELKLRIVERLAQHQLRTILVATVEKGVNDGEIGDILEFALQSPYVRAVYFQLATHVGRHRGFDPMDRITIPDVIKAIVDQTDGKFRKEDFIPIPCPHPICTMFSYVYVEGEKVTPIPRIVEVEDYLDYFKNRAVPIHSDMIKEALEGIYSMSAVPGSEKLAANLCLACGLSTDLKDMEKKIKIVGIKGFMDAYTFDLNRVMKCCIHEILPDGGGMVPFCVYNVLRRRGAGYGIKQRDKRMLR